MPILSKLVSSTVSELVLWHRRLGHASYLNLKYLRMERMVEDLPSIESCKDMCEGRQIGKQTRLPFPKSMWKASEKLQLIYSDVCSPMNTTSLSGSKNFFCS